MITILTSGSRGDIEPYIALAIEIKKFNEQVRIVCGASFKAFVESFEIECCPLSADYKTADIDPNLLKEARSSDNPFKMLKTFKKMESYASFMTYEMYQACRGSDLIIYHPGCTIGYFAAEQMNVPSVLASPFPLHKTKETASVVTYGRYIFPRRLSYSLLQNMLWMASKVGVETVIKNKKVKTPYENIDKKHIAIVSCSDYIIKRPLDWNENIHQYGYWYLSKENNYSPPKGLIDFLNDGQKPIYFGFGSVFDEAEKVEMLSIIKHALISTGKRGVISGMGELNDLPQYIFGLEEAPHDWLFKKVCAVCHHGGAGTSAAGFRAGVPSIIIPFSNDQFAWAHRAYDLGIGGKPIPRKKLSSSILSDTINETLTPKIIEKSKEIGRRIRQENGAVKCAKIIVGMIK